MEEKMKNTFVKVLSLMIALMMVVGMFSTISFAADCAHDNSTAVGVVAPTCETAGFTKYLCNDCGEEYIGDIVPATGKHTWTTVAATEATCTDPAYKARKKCSACGVFEKAPEAVEGSKPLGHVYNIPYAEAATCTTPGFTTKKCARCGEIDKTAENFVEIPKLDHDLVYTVTTVPGTCTNGYYQVTCKACDYNKVIVEEKNHTMVDMTTTTEIKAGDECNYTYKSGKFCTKCKAISSDAVLNTNPTHATTPVVGDNGKITAENLNSAIAALGFGIGSAVKVDATCVADGYELTYCATCNVYFKNVLKVNKDGGHTWGEWGAVTPADTDENHAVNKTQTRTCTIDGCNAKETKVVKAATAHTYTGKGAIDPIAMTCTSNGYTHYECDLCTEAHDENVVYASGHTYGAWVKVDGYTCGDTVNAEVHTCTNAHCSTQGGYKEYRNITADTHNWVKTTVPATCIADAYYINQCSKCAATDTYTGTDKPTAGFDATNHVVKDKVTTGGTALKKTQSKDCVKPEKWNYACACGVMVNIITADANGHTIVEEGTWTSADGKTTKNFAETASTCKTQGQTKGKLCTVCGYEEVVPTKKALNPANHEDETPVQVGTTVPATCVAKSYMNLYHDCCKSIEKVESGEINPAAHNLVPVAEVPATCTTKGVAAHQKCSLCAKLFDLTGAAIDAPAVIDYYGEKKDGAHAWGNEIEEDPETCTDAGVKAHKVCADCDAWLVDGVAVDNAKNDKGEDLRELAAKIPAHGTAYTKRLSGLNSKDGPTCTQGVYQGIPTDPICEKCDLPAYWKAPTEHAGTVDHINQNVAPNYDCTKPTYTVHVCSACDYQWVTDYVAPAKTAHVFKGADGKYIQTTVGTPGCETSAVDTHLCQNPGCSVVETTAGAPATGHFYTTTGGNIAITFSCKDDAWKAFDGIKCDGSCGLTVSKDTVKHVFVTTDKAATCTEGGYHVEYCSDCNFVKVSTTTEKLGHSDKSTLLETVDGVEKYSCPVCGEYWTKTVAPKLNVTVTASADKVAAGETFTVTYAISGAAYTFSALDLQANVPAGTTLVGITSNVDGLYAVVAANGGISLVVANNAAGEAQKVTTDAAGTVLFTLTYAVNKTASTGDVTITVEDDAEKLADAADTVKVTAAGNLNGDTVVTAEDAQAIFAKIGTNDVASDVNCDGIVNLADVIALAKFAASAKTAADYLEMVGELDTLEAEVFALLESGKLNDVNNDKIVNITDAYALIARVNTAIATGYTNLGNMVTMEAVVAYLNVNASLVIA